VVAPPAVRAAAAAVVAVASAKRVGLARIAFLGLIAPALSACGTDGHHEGARSRFRQTLDLPGVSFQTLLRGQYLGAQNDGGGAVTATALVAQGWEKFTLIDENGGDLVSGDSVYLRAGSGQFFQALNGGGSTLNAASTNQLAWEAFKLVKQDGAGVIVNGDLVGLQCQSGAWVSAQDGGGGPVLAYGGTLGA